jgi:hypothetical protein
MVEKMTAVWLIILTIIVSAAVPSVLIWLTTTPHPKFLVGGLERHFFTTVRLDEIFYYM